MQDFLLTYYFWLQAVHIMAVISWMAGLFYLPRLYVYHSQQKPGSETAQTFKIMEYKLLKIIMNPAMIVTWVMGGLMLYANPDLMSQGWMHVKLTAVLLMSGFHGALSKYRKSFARDEHPKSEKFFRYLNEVPTVLMVVIVIMAIVKPF